MKAAAATMENGVPEELKLEILLRLPVRSLVSLKCVSKSWRSIISNPNFAKLHLQLSNYSQYPNRIFLPTSPQMKSIDINTSLDNDSDTLNLIFPPPIKSHSQVCIMGSCRGIVLLQTLNMDLLMWNPVTGAYKNIALPPRFKSPILFAFCYDESLDDYFVGLSYGHDYPYRRIRELFEVLSVRTNSWQNLDLHHHCIIRSLNRSGTIFNGAIHFIANYDDTSYTSPQVIAFDTTTKGLRKVPLPIGTKLECAGLGIHKGCLALTCASLNVIKVWVMREYGVKPSWTKLFSVYRFHQSDICCIWPLVFFKADEFVTSYHTKDGREGLSKWNDKGELLEHRAYAPNRSKTYAIAHTETLLPLP
ncbi:hypothetical protein K1719_037999 [Acacia pycnantha]|nr:hypothetical protein K1719_037999 [Acacia pycnantha]